jgi:hypothetical protein
VVFICSNVIAVKMAYRQFMLINALTQDAVISIRTSKF